MALEITDSTYEELVGKCETPVLLDCFAEWCGPCRSLLPVIEELAEEWKGRVLIAKVNVANSPQISQKFGIRNVPTLLFMKGGEVKEKQIGVLSKAVLEEKLKALEG